MASGLHNYTSYISQRSQPCPPCVIASLWLPALHTFPLQPKCFSSSHLIYYLSVYYAH